MVISCWKKVSIWNVCSDNIPIHVDRIIFCCYTYACQITQDIIILFHPLAIFWVYRMNNSDLTFPQKTNSMTIKANDFNHKLDILKQKKYTSSLSTVKKRKRRAPWLRTQIREDQLKHSCGECGHGMWSWKKQEEEGNHRYKTKHHRGG